MQMTAIHYKFNIFALGLLCLWVIRRCVNIDKIHKNEIHSIKFLFIKR